eukprot:9029536-Pyramimonas_sp.AAC.1
MGIPPHWDLSLGASPLGASSEAPCDGLRSCAFPGLLGCGEQPKGPWTAFRGSLSGRKLGLGKEPIRLQCCGTCLSTTNR